MKSMSKELIIMALLLMIVVTIVGMIFYEYMPNNKVIPEPITYSAETETLAVLQEIASTSTTNDSTGEVETKNIIKSYSIGSQELTTAASKQSYTSGKTDPFSTYVEPAGNTTTNTTSNGNTTQNNNTVNNGSTNSNGSSNGSSSNSGSSSSSSSGTFFEKPHSK